MQSGDRDPLTQSPHLVRAFELVLLHAALIAVFNDEGTAETVPTTVDRLRKRRSWRDGRFRHYRRVKIEQRARKRAVPSLPSCGQSFLVKEALRPNICIMQG